MLAKITLQEYEKKEANNIRTGQGTVAEPELMRRWHYDPKDQRGVTAFKKKLWMLRTGRDPCGELLVPIAINSQHRVYLVEDIARVELALQAWANKRLDREKP